MNNIIIEKEKIVHNINTIKSCIQDDNKSCKIIAILKANAYGVGYNVMAPILLENGIDMFGVTSVSEALELKKYTNGKDILVMNSTSIPEEVDLIVKNGFIASIGSFESLEILEKMSKESSIQTRYHINIDTGMCRFGFRANDILSSSDENSLLNNIVTAINESANIKLAGIYTHFRQSYEKSSEKTKEQFDLFINVINRFRKKEIDVGLKHCANTSAFFKYPYMHLDAVRVGSALVGRVQPGITDKLQRVGYLESTICEIRNLKAGDKVFYSGMFEAKTDMKVAVVEAGYKDGFRIVWSKRQYEII